MALNLRSERKHELNKINHSGYSVRFNSTGLTIISFSDKKNFNKVETKDKTKRPP